MARRIVAPSSVTLRKITGMVRPRRRIASYTAKPSRSGSCRSRTISCGQPDSAMVTPSVPVTATLMSKPAMSNASWYIAARSLRSSTSRTRGFNCMFPVSSFKLTHRAAEPELRSQLLDSDRRQVGRAVGIERRVEEMAQQHEVDAVADGRGKGRPIACGESPEAFIDARQLRLRAHGRVAVSWKVLGGREHAGGVDAVNHRRDRVCDRRRLGAVTAAPHDRALPAAHVRHRAE